MLRKIIKIDQELCNGCGLCAAACHEGAIVMADGKAKLDREDYCDGLGDCLPACPTGAITFETREAPAYDFAAVETNKLKKEQAAGGDKMPEKLPCGCPGAQARALNRAARPVRETAAEESAPVQNHLMQWPVQIQLAPVNAPYFDGAHLLVAADCTAYARGDFHNRFMKNRVTLIGCPKLDDVDYAEKLTAILARNSIRSLTVVRMEVPCCGGLEHAVKRALQASGKFIPWQVVTIATDGQILD